MKQEERAVLREIMRRKDMEIAVRQATGVCDGCPAPATHFGTRWQCCDSCNEEFNGLYNDFLTGNY